jgi:uncharacterized protein YqjF (DUF2071 family)
MTSKFFLFLLLFVAGILHLLYPQLFYPAIPFPFKFEINFLVGAFEIILALGLCFRKWQDLSARFSALWFLMLIPIHIFVSVYEIPMFGISNPLLLWLRTFMQPLLYLWALSLQNKGWIISQRWKNLVFLHYAVDANKVQPLVPFPLDLYQGQAVVSIVPFVMSRIRFPFLPSLPGLSRLLELNLRTYVIVNNKPAVYFFTLDSNHLPGVLVAKWFFSLPYRWIKLNFSFENHYVFSSPDFAMQAEINDEYILSDFDLWSTERYALFTKKADQVWMGVVEHPRWKLQKVKLISFEDNFSKLFGIDLNHVKLLSAAYSDQIDVRFKPFVKVN